MSTQPAVRVRISAPAGEARRLASRLTRGGIVSAPDDGNASEILVTVGVPSHELAPYRARCHTLCVVGAPAGPYFAAGADEVVVPGEPEILFRRLKLWIERADLQDRLERMSQRTAALEQGLADAAHDMRSPLHASIGYAEQLERDPALPAKLRADAQTTLKQAERALQVAERILENARRDNPLVEPIRVDLTALLDDAVRAAEAPARAKGVMLASVPPARSVEIRADREMLARLLDNLVANAVRATPRGGLVEVSGWRSSPRHVRLSVRDTGIGMDAPAVAKITAGLAAGRGLRICRDIAEKHGGELWAESRPGEGSQFVVELPLSFPQSRPRVLVVSDDQKWVREVARSLREACDVRSATVAAARLSGKKTDLVLVESGRAQSRSLAALRNAAKGAQVPVIELPSELAAARLARTLAHLTN
ncbi:MAG TPA: HAMP domain-containing sensor histidine kinase [Myxococcales bacterium]|nr:HAMP domain-containing sensor histidine kinase [Myxococcales bacterium]